MRPSIFLCPFRLRTFLCFTLLVGHAQAFTGKQGIKILIAESLGIPLGMMGGALGGAALGYGIGSMIPDHTNDRRTTVNDADSLDYYEEDHCCMISFTPEQAGALVGLVVGFGVGGFLGQSTGVYVGARMQDLHAGFWSTLLATASGDAIGFVTAGILMIPLNAYPEQEWIPLAAVAGGLSVAMAAPVLWIGHKNRSIRPAVTLLPHAKNWSHMQFGMQAALLQF